MLLYSKFLSMNFPGIFKKKKKTFKKSILGFKSFRKNNINQKLNASIGFPGKFGVNSSRLTFNFIHKGLIQMSQSSSQCQCMVGVGKVPEDAEEKEKSTKTHKGMPIKIHVLLW